jgi:large subunit ribosomal protein L29
MKAAEIKNLSKEELVDQLNVAKDALSQLQLAHAVSDLENPVQIRYKRKDVARILTEMHKRELAEQ